MFSDRKAHFDHLYQTSTDPWDYATSGYERDKYDATLARLTRHHYTSVIEVGCSIGVLSARLQTRCDRFLGLDLSKQALQQARLRLAHCSNVALRQVEVPRRWPHRKADLIILSEVLYYLSAIELRTLARCVNRSLMPGAEIVIVAWTGKTDTALTGAEATHIFVRALLRLRGMRVRAHRQTHGYLHYTLLCAGNGLHKT